MPDRLPEINLLPEVRQESAFQAILYFIFVGLIIILFIVLGYVYFSTNSKLKSAQMEMSELEGERDTLQIQIGQLEADDTENSYENAVTFAEYYALPASVLITEFNRLLPDDSYIRDYTYNSSAVNIVTHFETLDTIAEYTSRLTDSEFITDATVGSINTFALKEEESEADLVLYNVIPRYESNFSLTINKERVREELVENE